MSRSNNIVERKRISQIGTGLHVVMIADLGYLLNEAGEFILKDGHKVMAVLFKKDGNLTHEEHYAIDEGPRHQQFKKVLISAKAIPAEGKPTKKDAVGKRLWVAIKEVHHISDDVVIQEDGKPVIEYFIFKTIPFVEGAKAPTVPGNPLNNNGVCSGDFIDYKNFAL